MTISPAESRRASLRAGTVVVDALDSTVVDLPLRRPHRFRTTTMNAQSVLLVRVRTTDGAIGVGEGCVPGGPWWGGESVETMKVIVDRYLAPVVLGADASQLPRLRDRMDQTVAANPVAKSAVETALWDAWARTLEVGVSVLLGGRYRDQLPVTWAIGAAEPDAVVDEALEKIDSARHASIKLKMGALEPERDVARVEKIADALSGRTSIRVDLNGAWDEFTGMRYLSRLRDAGIALVEQPTPGWNLDAMQRITGAAEVPVMADESLTSEHDALALARRNAADVFSVKIGKSGGYLAARRIAAVASAAGIPCHGGTAIESPVGTLAAAQFLCSLPPVTYGSELFGPLLMTDGLFTEPLDYVDGSLRLPDGPGFGRDLDLERVRRYERR